MARSSKKKPVKKPIGIICEGPSEKQYFNMLKQKYRHKRVKLELISKGRSGKELIKYAQKWLNNMQCQTAYVVFDRDKHENYEIQECICLAKQASKELSTKKEKREIKIVFSSIAFEVWILMHFEPVNRAYSNEQLNRRLSKYFKQDYKRFKGSEYDSYLIDRIETAHSYAEKLFERHHNMVTDDPYTNVHISIQEIFNVSRF